MSNQNTTTSQKVPMGQKVAFGIGMLANQMFPAVMGIFMVVLVQDLGFPGWMWGVIFFLPRVFDSITDPIMGFISDNTKSKWGRRRQYVFIGSIIMGCAFVIMWQLYRDNGLSYNFAYFLGWSFVFYLGLTIFSVPYVAMGYEMSDDFHERTNLMAVAQWIGQWAWVIAPWFWVIMYDPDWFPSADIATRTLATWVGVIFMLCAMVPAIFIKSKSTLDEDYTPMTYKTLGGSLQKILYGFIEAFKIKPFRKMCVATFLIFNAFNTVATFTFFIIVYYLFAGDTGASGIWPTLFGSVGALMTTFLVIPTVAYLSKKLGKKNAFLVSQGISIVGYILLWFLLIPGKPYMFIFALPFFAFGIGSLFTIMMSMTADVIDLDELQSGKRREGIFGAIYWWMVKFGFAIAGLASGAILSSIGFDSDLAVQPAGAITGLRLFFSGLPIAGTLIAIFIMWDYDVSEERAVEISAILKARKAAQEPISPSFFKTNKLKTIVALSPEARLMTDLAISSKNTADLKMHFQKSLNSGIHGICFSPYLEGQEIGDTISKKQINQRMDVIAPHTKWVRSFSCSDGNEYIPISANQRGLRTMTGAWIGKDKVQNDKEINALIKLAQDGQVHIAVVGNEALMREDVSEAELLAYIYRVKEALPDIPVGYVDAYFQFHERPKLVEACDVILANCYPFWEGCPIDQATVYLNQMYEVTRLAAKGKRVIITETGWPNEGASTEGAVPSDDKAMQYFINVNNWAKNEGIHLFYFSSFDESWKVHQEGNVGARWGIWDKNENLKYK